MIDSSLNVTTSFSSSYVSRRLKKEVFIPAELEDVTVHVLRSSFASHLSNHGFHVYDVSNVMAHSDTKVTQKHYLDLFPERKREMYEALEKVYEL